MGAEEDAIAPTVRIETVLVVRPIKVIGLLFGALAVFLLLLAIAATTWVEADGAREGLWERCTYNKTIPDWVDCDKRTQPDWVKVCLSLSLSSVIVSVIGIVATSVGLRTANFQSKYKLYWVGLSCFFIGALLALIALVIFPIKFLEEITNRDEAHWGFGWAYIVGWIGSVFEFTAGILVLVDKGAEEIIYREKVVQADNRNGIEDGDPRNETEANTAV